MAAHEGYTTEQERTLAGAFHGGGALTCPACEVPMDRRAVPPRPDVSYVRDRVLLLCPSCHRTHVIDRREPA